MVGPILQPFQNGLHKVAGYRVILGRMHLERRNRCRPTDSAWI